MLTVCVIATQLPSASAAATCVVCLRKTLSSAAGGVPCVGTGVAFARSIFAAKLLGILFVDQSPRHADKIGIAQPIGPVGKRQLHRFGQQMLIFAGIAVDASLRRRNFPECSESRATWTPPLNGGGKPTIVRPRYVVTSGSRSTGR